MHKKGNGENSRVWGARKRQLGALSFRKEGLRGTCTQGISFAASDVRSTRGAKQISHALTATHAPLYTSVYKGDPSQGAQSIAANRSGAISLVVKRNNQHIAQGIIPMRFFVPSLSPSSRAHRARLFSLSRANPLFSPLGG